MTIRYDNKVAIVTGAGSGLGGAVNGSGGKLNAAETAIERYVIATLLYNRF